MWVNYCKVSFNGKLDRWSCDSSLFCGFRAFMNKSPTLGERKVIGGMHTNFSMQSPCKMLYSNTKIWFVSVSGIIWLIIKPLLNFISWIKTLSHVYMKIACALMCSRRGERILISWWLTPNKILKNFC